MATNIGNKYLKAWLTFNNAPTEDAKGNSWTTYGNPTVGTANAINGNALQLDGHSCLKCTLKLGGKDFTIDGWVFVDSSSPQWARIINIFSKTTGNPMLILEKAQYQSNKFNLWGNNNAALTNYAGEGSVSSVSCVGSRVHFCVCYSYSAAKLELYIDGTRVAYVNAKQYAEQDFDIYVGSGSQELNEDLGVIGSIDELRIYDGWYFAYDNGNVPSAADYSNIFFNCDTQRLISNNVSLNVDTVRNVNKIWRYENYGTADLLSIAGTTVTDLDKSQAVYQSAFYQTARAKCFDIPATKEIWIRCDVYCNLTNRWRIYDAGSTGTIGICSQTNKDLDLWVNDNNVKTCSNAIIQNQLQTVLLHMISDSSAGIVEAWLDGGKLYTYTGNVNNGNDFADIYLQSDGAGTFFSNVIISNAEVGINEHTKFPVTLSCDLLRLLLSPTPISLSCDTCRQVFRSNTLRCDLVREIVRSAQLDFDTFRNVQRSLQLNLDVVRTLPHNVFSAPIDSFGDIPDFNQSSSGLQSFEIRISEQQITDIVTYTTVNPVDILEQVKGQYLDYKFNMRIESIYEQGILKTCNCCSDIDEILFTQIEYDVPENEKWHWADGSPEVYGSPDSTFKKPEDVPPAVEASVHVAHIAEVLNKNYVIQFDDFVSTVDGDSGGVTYNDLIRSIFGWSSRIPHKLINCYIRDDTLFVVQRGHEQNIIDLSNSTFEIVTCNKSLMRTFWGNEIWSKTETRSEHIGWRKIYDKDDYKTNNSQNGNANYSYDNSGLVTQTSIYNDDGSTTYIDYQYTELSNGRKVLASESHSTYKDGKRIDYQHIQHTYLNQGQSHVMATGEDGDYLGSDVGQSIGDDRVTPWGKYTSMVIQSVHKDRERTIYGLTNFDSSFPIDGDKKLKEITADIIWLNRKTQEIITINLYDFPHVIDFNDRLIVNGAEFFLKSNVAVRTPRIVNKQTLQLVRWY